MKPGETAHAAPKGNAEALRQKNRFRTILRKGRTATPDHRRCNLPCGGNLSGNETGAQSRKERLCVLFCCPKNEKCLQGGKTYERTEAYPAIRCPCGRRCGDGGLRRMGNAHPVPQRYHCRASVHPAGVQPVRRVPHGTSAHRGPGAPGVSAACADQQRGGAGRGAGPVLHHPQRERRRGGRCVPVHV